MGHAGHCFPLSSRGKEQKCFIYIHAWNFNHLPLGLSESCPPALHSEENGKGAGALATSFNLAVLFSEHVIRKQLQTPPEWVEVSN